MQDYDLILILIRLSGVGSEDHDIVSYCVCVCMYMDFFVKCAVKQHKRRWPRNYTAAGRGSGCVTESHLYLKHHPGPLGYPHRSYSLRVSLTCLCHHPHLLLHPLPGSTWSPMSFILDDGLVVDGLNLGVVLVDEVAQSVILVYTVCFHHYRCSPSSVMMVETLDDGLSWSRPRNLSEQLGVKSFAPGPGFGIQVNAFLTFWVSV